VKEGEEEKKEEAPKREEKVEEVEVEEESKEITFEDYMASKKQVNFRKEARKVEENKKTNLQATESTKEKVTTIGSTLTSRDTYNAGLEKGGADDLLMAF
jgi:hypothetical protein